MESKIHEEKTITKITEEYKGIGGWLILIIIGYLRSIFSFIKAIYEIYNFYLDGTMEILLNVEHEYYNPQLYRLVNFELLGHIILVIATVFILIYMFYKKKNYPKYAIGLIISVNLFVLLDLLICDSIGVNLTSYEISAFIGNIIGASIWITYFIRSKRVKNTFIK